MLGFQLSVAMVVLFATSARALQCYKCADFKYFGGIIDAVNDDGSLNQEREDLPMILNSPEARDAMPPCEEFNATQKRFVMECGLTESGVEHQGCAKAEYGKATMRFCLDKLHVPGCARDPDDLSMGVCYCKGDLCNTASGLVSGFSLLLSAVVCALVVHS